MSIYTLLKKEHDKILNYLNRIEACGNQETEKRNKLFNTLKETLIIHSRAEKETLYEPLKAHEKTRDKISFYEEEQGEIEDLLSILTDPDLSGPLWHRKFQQLKEELEYHIHDDEHELFPKAQSVIKSDQANELEQTLRNNVKKERQRTKVTKRPQINHQD
jgi:hypothetical protein